MPVALVAKRSHFLMLVKAATFSARRPPLHFSMHTCLQLKDFASMAARFYSKLREAGRLGHVQAAAYLSKSLPCLTKPCTTKLPYLSHDGIFWRVPTCWTRRLAYGPGVTALSLFNSSVLAGRVGLPQALPQALPQDLPMC